MTIKTLSLSHSLLFACLATVSLTACQTAHFLPGPAAVTPADARVIDSGEGGTAQMSVKAATPDRRVLFVQADIHELELVLYRVNGTTETRVATATLTAGQLSRTITFSNLRRETAYRVQAIARADTGAVLNHLDTSDRTFTVGSAEAVLAQAVPVTLKNTLVEAPGASRTVGIAVSEGVSLPTASMALQTLALSNVALSFSGKQATVTWQSNMDDAFDYDVELYQATDPTIRVATTATDAESGLMHAKTLEMGTLANGAYIAKITVKGDTARASSNSVAYTAPVANTLSHVQLTYDLYSGTFTVTWASSSSDAFDYDVVLKSAYSHQAHYETTAVNLESGSSHTWSDDAYSLFDDTYYAVVSIKGTAISAQSTPTPIEMGGGIPGGGDTGWGGTTVF